MTVGGRCSKYVTAEEKCVGTTDGAEGPGSGKFELPASCDCALSRRGIGCDELPLRLFAAFKGSVAE